MCVPTAPCLMLQSTHVPLAPLVLRADAPYWYRFYDDMAEVDDDDEEDYDERDRANANELSAMERQV